MRTVLLLLLLALSPRDSDLRREVQVITRIEQGPVAEQGIHREISGEIVRETSHFQIYAEHAYVPVDLDWLQTELENIHAYLVERTGVQTSERFAITFRPPDTAPSAGGG